MSEFKMPALGADMDYGTLVEWLKKPGDPVARGDIIAVVESQKGAIEVEVFENGTVETLIAKPGDKLPVGATMAIIRGPGEAAVTPPKAAPAPQAPPVVRAATAQPAHAHRITPAARRLALQLGIDADALAGSGLGGAVSIADVEAASRAAHAPAGPAATMPAAPAPAPAPAKPAATMRAAIGAAMARSKREIPHYYLAHTIDFEPALRWLEAENLKRPVAERLLYGVLLLKAVALTLREFPELNGYFTGNGFAASAAIHLGVAISIRQGGLIAPAIHDADKRSVADLMAAFRDLVRRARAGGLRSSELSDGTITVTSLGDQGVEGIFPIIYPPQVAIVGFGTVVARPWVVDDTVRPRRVVTASVAGDHRASDGHRGALFLAALGRRLQEPETL